MSKVHLRPTFDVVHRANLCTICKCKVAHLVELCLQLLGSREGILQASQLGPGLCLLPLCLLLPGGRFGLVVTKESKQSVCFILAVRGNCTGVTVQRPHKLTLFVRMEITLVFIAAAAMILVETGKGICINPNASWI